MVVFGRQNGPYPSAELWRADADIHRDIENFALHHTAQLGLGMTQLIVQAAQHPARRARMVVLHEGFKHASRGQSIRAEGFQEEATRVFEDTGLDEKYSRKGRFDNLHARPQGWRIGRRASVAVDAAKGRL